MHMESVQKYVVDMTRTEAIELRDAIGALAGNLIKDNPLEELYEQLVAMVGHKYDWVEQR